MMLKIFALALLFVATAEAKPQTLSLCPMYLYIQNKCPAQVAAAATTTAATTTAATTTAATTTAATTTAATTTAATTTAATTTAATTTAATTTAATTTAATTTAATTTAATTTAATTTAATTTAATTTAASGTTTAATTTAAPSGTCNSNPTLQWCTVLQIWSSTCGNGTASNSTSPAIQVDWTTLGTLFYNQTAGVPMMQALFGGNTTSVGLSFVTLGQALMGASGGTATTGTGTVGLGVCTVGQIMMGACNGTPIG